MNSVPSVRAAKQPSEELCFCEVPHAVCFQEETHSCLFRCGFLAQQDNASAGLSICVQVAPLVVR